MSLGNGAKRRVLAAMLVVFGGFGAVAAASLLIPAWRAAHGDGHTGTFTLTEPNGCDRYQPPQQRCGWFGDFVSDDGLVVQRHKELSGGLPPGAAVGETVAARDSGSRTVIYPLPDAPTWKEPAGYTAVFTGILLLGVVLLRPWRWARRKRD
ncbi:hypothetical protein AB0H83_31430 [Dactylosporangium sp. NPDC050688]|uniref:hypothetical protein n=1 Tax=Dactylosporangium sp. NPDC050688 TaxID=3157217 RepID=UPI0033C2BF0C